MAEKKKRIKSFIVLNADQATISSFTVRIFVPTLWFNDSEGSLTGRVFDFISFEGDYMSIEIICREVSRIMRKYDEPDPWKLAEAMGIIVQVMPLGSTDKSCKGFFLRVN